MKNISKDLMVSALWDGIKFILAMIFVGSSTLFTSELITDSIDVLKEYKVYITTITTTAGLLLFMYLYQKLRKFKPIYPNLEFDFMVLEKEITLEFIDRKTIIYKKRNFLKALKKNLDAYHDKYHWTGGDEVRIHSNIKGQQFQKTLRKNIFQLYEILFSHTLKKGDKIETELIWDLKDLNAEMVPFISATIQEPTGLLIFKVSFSKDLDVDHVVCEVTSSIGDNKIFETSKIDVDRNNTVAWIVKNPSLLYHYEMKWFY